MKRIIPIILITATVALTGCQHANAGTRCKGTGWGENGAWILQCKKGRWSNAITKADYLRLVAPAPAPAAPATPAAPTTVPAPTTAVAPATMGTGTSATEQQMANEIFSAINSERAARGLPAAARSYGTNALESTLITGMDTNNPHPAGAIANKVWPDYPILYHGEITTWGTPVHYSAQAVINWMNSAGHRPMIVNPKVVALQVAVVCMSDGRYVAKVQDAAQATLPTDPPIPNALDPRVTTPQTGSRCK